MKTRERERRRRERLGSESRSGSSSCFKCGLRTQNLLECTSELEIQNSVKEGVKRRVDVAEPCERL